jgi:CHAT domain-containing protein
MSKILTFFLVSAMFDVAFSFGQNDADKNAEQTKFLFENYKYEEAISYGSQAIEDLENIHPIDSLEIAKHYLHIVPSYYKLRKHEISIEESEKALKYCPDSEEGNNVKAGILYWRSFPEYFLNKPYLSYYSKIEALDLLKSLKRPDFKYLTAVYAELSLDMSFMGYLENASYYIEKAYAANEDKTEQEIKENRYKLEEDLSLWLLYRSAQVYNKKIHQKFDIALKMKLKEILNDYEIHKINHPEDWTSYKRVMYGAINGYYGNTFIKTGDLKEKPDSALYYYKKGLDQFTKDENTFHHNLLTYNTSVAYDYQGNYQLALNIVEDLILNDNPSSTAYLTHKANLYLKLKKYDQWKDLVYKTLSGIHDSPSELESDYSNFVPSTSITQISDILSLAESIENTENVPPELKAIEKKLFLLSSLQFKNSYRLANFNQRLNSYYKSSIHGLLTLFDRDYIFDDYSIKALLEDAENIENRLAWQQFNKNRQFVSLPKIDSLEKVEFKYRAQLVEAKKNKNKIKEDSIKEAIEKFKRITEKKYPKFFDFTQNHFEIEEFQKLIPDHEIILKYIFFDDEFVIFEITKDSVKWDLKPFKLYEKQLIEDHLNQIKTPSSNQITTEQLTQLLIPNDVYAFESIVVIPDKQIYGIPFETLSHNKEYLIQNHSMRYSSHLRFVYIKKDSENKINIIPKVTLFAPTYEDSIDQNIQRNSKVSLEGAQKEALIIKKLFETNAYVGKEATKAQFLEQKSKGNILHLAMHATMDNVNPEFSHFNFSNNEKLYLEELYALNIPIDLAVLSACNTAVGKEDNSLNIASLQRAFSFAGAEATVASLWEVPDETTSQIMIAFYDHLKDGHKKSVALQKAKIDYLNNNELSKLQHPYYWSGFVLYGEDSSVSHQNNEWLWLVIILMILSLVYFLVKRKRNIQ